MNTNRPVFLDLTKIYFPIMAIVSILHRISGVILFLALPYLLWLLHCSITAAGFQNLTLLLQNPLMKLINLGILAAALFHLVAGVRHLLMDMNIGETLQGGRIGAWAVICATIVLVILAAIWLF